MQVLPSSQTRPFGRSTVNLSALGFGAAPIGNLYQAVTDDVAIAAALRAYELGIRYFDTAPFYGFGLSETRLGATLKSMGELPPVISTKVGRLLVPTNSTAATRHGFTGAPAFAPVFDYTYDGVMRSFDASLVRLGVDSVDILLAHDLGEITHGAAHSARFREFIEGGYRAMQKLRESGQVRAIGLGANEWQVCEQALTHGDFDGFLLAGRYTLLDQSAGATFFPLCAQRGAAVILGGPFNSGILATGTRGAGPLHFNYEAAPADIVQRVYELEQVCLQFNVSLAAAALQFPAAHPQICSVVAGLATVEQVERAVALMNSLIPLDFWLTLQERGLLHPLAPVPQTAGQAQEAGATAAVTAAVTHAILLHPDDNVLVCVKPIRAGERLRIDDRWIAAQQDIGVGHKLARYALNPGDHIIKYGAPVGSVTAAAACGDHVHLHNMRSDYIPSHTRTRQNEDRSKH